MFVYKRIKSGRERPTLYWKVWTISNLQQLQFWWIRYMSSNFIRSSRPISPQKILIQISVLGEELKCREMENVCESVNLFPITTQNIWWIYMSPNFIESSDQIVWKIIPNQFIYKKDSSHTVRWKLCAQVQSHFQFWWIYTLPDFMASSNQIPLFFHSILCSLQQFVNKSAGGVR